MTKMEIKAKITPSQVFSKLKKAEEPPAPPPVTTSFSKSPEEDKEIEKNLRFQVASHSPESSTIEGLRTAETNIGAPITEKNGIDVAPGEAQKNWLDIIPRETNGTRKHKIDVTHLYRSYKNTPHAPLSIFAKYIVHRIEHQADYSHGKTLAEDHDADFLGHHQVAGKANQVTAQDLNAFLYHHSNLIPGVLAMQRQIHGTIQEHSPWAIKPHGYMFGQPGVNLTRGLKVTAQERGQDHALASYADQSNTGFGRYMHHQMVPMKNVWYSYDAGPQEASSGEYGAESEYLVSPHHNRIYGIAEGLKTEVDEEGYSRDPFAGETEKILPSDAYLNGASLKQADPFAYFTHLANNAGRLPPHMLADLASNQGDNYYVDHKQLFKNPNLTPDQALKFFFQAKRKGEARVAHALTMKHIKTGEPVNTIALLNRAIDEAYKPENFDSKRTFTLSDVGDMLRAVNNAATEEHDPNGEISTWVKAQRPRLKQLALNMLSEAINHPKPGWGTLTVHYMEQYVGDIGKELENIASRTYPAETLQKSEQDPTSPKKTKKDLGYDPVSLSSAQDKEIEDKVKSQLPEPMDYNQLQEGFRLHSDKEENPMLAIPYRPKTRTRDIEHVHLYRAYKHTPHQPLSLAMKYAIHRIEHRDEYTDPGSEAHLDNQFIKTNQNAKNAHVSIDHLKSFLHYHSDLIPQLLKEQRNLHDTVANKSHYRVSKTISKRQPGVILSRGRGSVTPDKVGPDHAIASYADIDDQMFGPNVYEYHVPMKNIWYSYDVGPKAGASHNYGPENEYLVSPHDEGPIQVLSPDHGRRYDALVRKLVPAATYAHHKEWNERQNFIHAGSMIDKLPREELDQLSKNPNVSGLGGTPQLHLNPNANMEHLHNLFPNTSLFMTRQDKILEKYPAQDTADFIVRQAHIANNHDPTYTSSNVMNLLANMSHRRGEPYWIDVKHKVADQLRGKMGLFGGHSFRDGLRQIITEADDDIEANKDNPEFGTYDKQPLQKTQKTAMSVATAIGKLIPKRNLYLTHYTTKKLDNGLYHHIFSNPDHPRMLQHAISDSADPNKPLLSSVEGGVGHGEFNVSTSKVNPLKKGKGYGKLAYLAALAHHGKINSDLHTSSMADKLWEHLPTMHPGIVRTMGAAGTDEYHRASVDNAAQQSLKDKLYGHEEKRLADKLIKSVGSEVEARKNLVKLNREFEVTGLAGYSKDGNTVYVDRRIPNFKGHDVAPFLLVHEITEKSLIDKLGYGYGKAHSLALRAEQRAVEEAGLSWIEYCHFMRHLMTKIGQPNQAHNVPANLENPSQEHSELKVSGYHHETLRKSRGNYVGEIHPHKPYLVWTRTKSGDHAWHPDVPTTKSFDAKNAAAAEAHIKKLPPEHHEIARAFFKKVFSHPNRHLRTARTRSGGWEMRARHLAHMFEGNPDYKMSVTSPTTLEFYAKERHGENAEENAAGSRFKFDKLKNTIESF